MSIGVDVERWRPLPDLRSIATRYFHERERKWILDRTDAQLVRRFFEIWVRKEAVVKGIGKGLSLDLRSFAVSPASGDHTILESDDNLFSDWLVVPFSAGPEISAALAVSKIPTEVRVIRISPRDVFG